MGLKQDLVNAKIEALRLAGATEPIPTEALELQVDLETEALMKFLTTCEFRITQLNAPVTVEDFSIPPQQGDVLPSVVANSGFGTFVPMTPALGGIPVVSTIQNGTNGVLNKAIDINKDFGGLRSTGYVHIGQDPDSQDSFNVEDEEGQRDFTTVKLIRDDIEDLL
tara:strand:+ start:301 stop:798 length:498 start_codon:yes stop_codon:yes gene_type:complete